MSSNNTASSGGIGVRFERFNGQIGARFGAEQAVVFEKVVMAVDMRNRENLQKQAVVAH